MLKLKGTLSSLKVEGVMLSVGLSARTTLLNILEPFTEDIDDMYA